MSLAYVGFGSAASGSGATVTLPQDVAGLANGDMMTMVIYSNANPLSPATPPGDWTLRAQSTVGNPAVFVYTKIANNEPASYTITRGAAVKTYIARIVAHRSNIGAIIVVDDAVGAALTSVAFTWFYPSVTTQRPNGALLCFGNMGTNRATTPPGDMTERWDELLATMRIYAMTSLLAAAGPTGTKACQDPTGAINNSGNGVSIALSEIQSALDATLVTFLRVQAAKQTAFDVAAAPTFALPVVFEYAEAQTEQLAGWDSGTWTPNTIVEQTATFATFTLRGALFFELLPLLFGAGFGQSGPGSGPPYNYAGGPAAANASSPTPYTFRFGGNDAVRVQGSMVQVQDAYLDKLTLTFNLNDKAVTFESQWFGRFVDDNDGAGYAPLPVTLPPSLQMVNGLRSLLSIQDASLTEGGFTGDATAFQCSLMEWQLVIDTGLRPAWAGDGNTLTYCGVRHEEPSASFTAYLRTNLSNYAVTKVKSNLRTFQVLRLMLLGDMSRSALFDFTGRWLPNFSAHDRNREEVVMQPIFSAATPSTQTVTPHFLSWAFTTNWNGGA